jgi:uncharacterized protein YeaO (DUF488 family)
VPTPLGPSGIKVGIDRGIEFPRAEVAMEIRTRRVYETPAPGDGRRILIDRLWPRGLAKQKARIDFWAREVAPSTALRRWYQHDPEKWDEFRRRYFAELDATPDAVAALRAAFGTGAVTFVFGSREERLNNATALREYLEDHPPS